MGRSGEIWLARGLVLLVVMTGAIALGPELEIGRVDLNDSVFHLTIADRLAQRLAAGKGVLDFWMDEWSFGYPVVRDYQPLGHWLVVAGHLVTFRQIPVDAVFTVLRWLLLAFFPLTAYAACRMIPVRPLTAAAVALLWPLTSAPNLYGIDYGSYVWRGNGLYTQLVAMHLFALAVGLGSRAIRGGRQVTLAGLVLGLTFLAHFMYGYMAAATLVLIAALPGVDAPPRRRFVRLAWVALLSIVVSAPQIVPMLSDGPFINRSRWEPVWKWESFGVFQVLSLTASGNLLDGGRLPILSLLALAGAVAVVRRRSEAGEERFGWLLALTGALLWLFLFCGRAAWGPLFSVIGLGDAAHLHRFVGGAQWFLLILSAIGLTRVWTLPYRRRWRYPGAFTLAITLLLLWSPITERRTFLRDGYTWGRESLAAYETQRATVAQVTAEAARRGGRAYPGLAAAWGAELRVGYVPFYAFLSRAHVPAVAFLYHSMALPADVMVRFDETRPEQYRLFDIRSVVSDAARTLPPFLRPAANHGTFRVHEPPPSGGPFDAVTAPNTYYVDRRTIFDVNDAWLKSGWPAARAHLLLDYESATPTVPRPRLGHLSPLSQPAPTTACGNIERWSEANDVYRADIVVAGAGCFALFKMTYHPNWRATVDGEPRRTVMLSPGFVGVPLAAGRHSVELRYEPGVTKTALLFLALPLIVAAFVLERRGTIRGVETRAEQVEVRWSSTATYALLTLLLVLPCAAPYFTNAQPNGHDVLQYLPRLVEFHENLRHGILLPRWAPDFGSGQGQPLFLLNPPLFYYISALFHFAGFSFIASMNAACIVLILASAASMFLLARWYFGPAGGAIAAVAYVWAPYTLVDLYVRTAWAEFASFPFYPLAIYGFARHAAEGNRKYLVLGSLAYAAIWYAHSPAALLFSPLLGAFVVFLSWRARSPRLLLAHGTALAGALLLAAVIWLPASTEAAYTHSDRLREGPLKYSNHYVTPKQFFATEWGYGVSVAGDQDGMPFMLGWPLLIVAACAAIHIARSESEQWKQWLAFFAGAVVVLCFLMTQRAHALWDALPQLQYVAFPWRLLAPVTFCLALLSGAVVLAAQHVSMRWRNVAYAAILAILVLGTVRHAKPSGYLTLDEHLWTPRQIAAHGAVAGTFETFEPRWVKERPTYTAGQIVVTRGSASATVANRTPQSYVAFVRAASESELELPLAYFPGWRVRVNGLAQPVDTPSPMGRMRVTVPPGDHRVAATFERTPVRWAADLTSLAAAIGYIAAAFAFRRRRPMAAEAEQPRKRAAKTSSRR